MLNENQKIILRDYLNFVLSDIENLTDNVLKLHAYEAMLGYRANVVSEEVFSVIEEIKEMLASQTAHYICAGEYSKEGYIFFTPIGFKNGYVREPAGKLNLTGQDKVLLAIKRLFQEGILEQLKELTDNELFFKLLKKVSAISNVEKKVKIQKDVRYAYLNINKKEQDGCTFFILNYSVDAEDVNLYIRIHITDKIYALKLQIALTHLSKGESHLETLSLTEIRGMCWTIVSSYPQSVIQLLNYKNVRLKLLNIGEHYTTIDTYLAYQLYNTAKDFLLKQKFQYKELLIMIAISIAELYPRSFLEIVGHLLWKIQENKPVWDEDDFKKCLHSIVYKSGWRRALQIVTTDLLPWGLIPNTIVDFFELVYQKSFSSMYANANDCLPLQQVKKFPKFFHDELRALNKEHFKNLCLMTQNIFPIFTLTALIDSEFSDKLTDAERFTLLKSSVIANKIYELGIPCLQKLSSIELYAICKYGDDCVAPAVFSNPILCCIFDNNHLTYFNEFTSKKTFNSEFSKYIILHFENWLKENLKLNFLTQSYWLKKAYTNEIKQWLKYSDIAWVLKFYQQFAIVQSENKSRYAFDSISEGHFNQLIHESFYNSEIKYENNPLYFYRNRI